MPSLAKKDLIKISMLVPPIKEQKIIVQKLDALSAQTKTLEKSYQSQLKSLENLKKSLLEKAFSGEL